MKADTPLTTGARLVQDISEVPLGAKKTFMLTIPKGKIKDLRSDLELDSTTLEMPLAKTSGRKINFILMMIKSLNSVRW